MANEVKIKLEDYNKLLLESEALKRAFKIVERWDAVNVEIDPSPIKDYLLSLYDESELKDKSELSDRDYWHREHIVIGKMIKEDEDTEE